MRRRDKSGRRPTATLVGLLVLLLGGLTFAAPDPQPVEPASHTLRTVVLDPGHGGEDSGTVGQSGIAEKDVALDICQRVARVFEARLGTQRIVLTRRSTQTLDPHARTSIANGSKGDVLVAIHVASSVNPDIRGPRIYFTSNDLRVVELTERRLRPRVQRLVTGLSDAGPQLDLRLTPWATAQSDWIPRSRALAQSIARELGHIDGDSPAPVAELPLALLAGAQMPAVLVEVGYLSNPEDEELLQSNRHRDRLAGAIFSGIRAFAYPFSEKEAEEQP